MKRRSCWLFCAFAVASGVSMAQGDYLAGYMIIPATNRIDRSFNAGFSMYVAAWPLLKNYPGHQFQTGLPGTWMFAQYDGPAPERMYSDVEGGLGWWRDTRFPTATPKFIMGGVGVEFSEIANGPSHGWGTWEKPQGLYGVAQLSPWLLFPIDGLNLKQGTSGELFGYGYLPLPLSEAKTKTAGIDSPTGSQSWTLFLNTNNFKGPVAFFTPYFWASGGVREPRTRGMLLDARPTEPNTALQMETQYVPCEKRTDAKGEQYIRIAPTSFPRSSNDNSVLLHQVTSYNRSALWDKVLPWFNGGQTPSDLFNPKTTSLRNFGGDGYMTWQIHTPGPDGKELKVPIDWKAFVTPTALDNLTFGAKWNYDIATKSERLATFPEYFHLVDGKDPAKARWVPVSVTEVPTDTGLQLLKWERPVENPEEPYTTPIGKPGSWQTPGPSSGPFKARLGDGSVVTYYWFRFADQPALLNADLTKAERERMQVKVEKIHRNWLKTKNYLASPTIGGKLADLDPAQIVKPPKGLEVGYVPIVTKQELAKK